MVQSLPLQKGRAAQWRQLEPDKLPSTSPGSVGSQHGGRGVERREKRPAEMIPCSERKYNHCVRLTQQIVQYCWNDATKVKKNVHV